MFVKYSLIFGVLIFLLMLVVLFVYWQWYRSRFRRLICSFPEVNIPIIPIIGQSYIMFGNSREIIKTLFEKVTSSPLVFWLGPFPQILITKPEDLAVILPSSNAINKLDLLNKILAIPLGDDGLLEAKAPRWNLLRKAVGSAFATINLQHLIPDINLIALNLMQHFERHHSKGPFDVSQCVSHAMFSFGTRTLMGVDFNSTKCRVSQLNCYKAVETMIKIIQQRIYSFWLHADALFKMTPQYRTLNKHKKTIEYIRDQFLDLKIKTNLADKAAKSCKTNGFVDCLLQATKKYPEFTMDDVREQLKTFLFAGFDTTTMSISFSLLTLAYHREIQNKLYEELESLLPDRDQDVDLNILTQLTYLDKVVRETLRVFTIVPISGRHTSGPIELADGRIIPTGMNIILLYHLTHRDENHWPNPNVFDPERFNEENMAKRHPFAFIPFSGGRRNCVGAKLAMMQTKITVAKIIRKFVLTTKMSWEDITDFKYEITMRIQKPLNVEIAPRVC